MRNRITTPNLCSIAALTLSLLFVAARSEAETYTYDDLGRLTRVAYADGTAIEYTYDANGNRLALVANDSSGGDTGGGDTPAAGGGGGGGGGCYIETLTVGALPAVHRGYPSPRTDKPLLWAAAFACAVPVLFAGWLGAFAIRPSVRSGRAQVGFARAVARQNRRRWGRDSAG